MSRILRIRSKCVSEVGGEESAHLPPKRGSYIMESTRSLGEADCESSQREVLATSPVEAQDEGHGRASVMPSSVDVECSRKEQQETSTCVRYEITTKRLYTSIKKYAVTTKEHTTYSRFGTIVHRNMSSLDNYAITKPRNQQTFTTMFYYRRFYFNDSVTAMDLYIHLFDASKMLYQCCVSVVAIHC